MRLATWNINDVRTKLTEVFQELKLHKIDKCILTETKMKGKGSEEVEDNIHLYNRIDKDVRAEREVSIAVHKRFRIYIKSWEEVNGQIH